MRSLKRFSCLFRALFSWKRTESHQRGQSLAAAGLSKVISLVSYSSLLLVRPFRCIGMALLGSYREHNALGRVNATDSSAFGRLGRQQPVAD